MRSCSTPDLSTNTIYQYSKEHGLYGLCWFSLNELCIDPLHFLANVLNFESLFLNLTLYHPRRGRKLREHLPCLGIACIHAMVIARVRTRFSVNAAVLDRVRGKARQMCKAEDKSVVVSHACALPTVCVSEVYMVMNYGT